MPDQINEHFIDEYSFRMHVILIFQNIYIVLDGIYNVINQLDNGTD